MKSVVMGMVFDSESVPDFGSIYALSAYTSASNYPSSSTYTYVEY